MTFESLQRLMAQAPQGERIVISDPGLQPDSRLAEITREDYIAASVNVPREAGGSEIWLALTQVWMQSHPDEPFELPSTLLPPDELIVCLKNIEERMRRHNVYKSRRHHLDVLKLRLKLRWLLEAKSYSEQRRYRDLYAEADPSQLTSVMPARIIHALVMCRMGLLFGFNLLTISERRAHRKK